MWLTIDVVCGAGSRGYHVKVMSTRTLSKLNKFVDRTQPEAIVIDSHVAREELVGFLGGWIFGGQLVSFLCAGYLVNRQGHAFPGAIIW